MNGIKGSDLGFVLKHIYKTYFPARLPGYLTVYISVLEESVPGSPFRKPLIFQGLLPARAFRVRSGCL